MTATIAGLAWSETKSWWVTQNSICARVCCKDCFSVFPYFCAIPNSDGIFNMTKRVVGKNNKFVGRAVADSVNWRCTYHDRRGVFSPKVSPPPPTGTTSVTTRWRPPSLVLEDLDDGSPPKAPSNLHARTSLPSHLYLKLGPATY